MNSDKDLLKKSDDIFKKGVFIGCDESEQFIKNILREYYAVKYDAYSEMIDAFERSGLTIKQLAERMKCDYSEAYKIIYGWKPITLKTLSRVAKALDYRLVIKFIENVK